jgi:dTDP-4-amino-4,6-dideoxygalactose transaminase
MTIPVLDLEPEIESLWDDINRAIQRVLRDGHFIMGPDVAAFESEVAAFLDVKHAIGLNSGTDALVIGLRALGVGAGDEVITSPFTFIATAEAATNLGAKPVFVDIDPLTFNLDPQLVEQAITPRTKAIIPVHLYGHAANMAQIMEIASRHNLLVLEDVAQAFGGEFNKRKLGTIGHAGAFSFFPSKNLGAYGDGGMLVTNDDRVAEVARLLRVHGARNKYHNEVPGYSSRLDTIQAAILRVKLLHVEEWNMARRAAANRYHDMLKQVPGIQLPGEYQNVLHVYHQYTIRVLGNRRDQIQKYLSDGLVSSMVYYPVPLHQLPVYENQPQLNPLPHSERAALEVLSLPMWPQIPEATQRQVVEVLANGLTQ